MESLLSSLLSPRSCVEGTKSVVCPRPSFPRGLNRASFSSESLSDEEAVAVVPRAATKDSSDLDASISELRRILEVDCTLDTDPAPFLGVSPPLRSGACNPLAQDSQWMQKAQQASRTSLEALRTMDRSGAAGGGGRSCRGDFRLLLSPPSERAAGALLAGAAPGMHRHYEPAADQGAQNRRGAPPPAGTWRGNLPSPDAHIFG